ncbi:precorrin-6A/cobalt-precorrin-6A reductase [Nonomuraea sp. NPDC050556]|uniref:precorrin-6A/cobalt-precorrin-6A reductase n=1 Tax=Nonomuraea sp. NPDC050556 TaxID=3364369 RepID=UPI00379E076F
MRRVLILGGTAEARALAGLLVAEGVFVVSSLAGRVSNPRLPVGEVHMGGFGGVDGLAGWLGANAMDAVVDATHPFAARMTASAAEVAARTGIPLLVLRRAGWREGAGDAWTRVGSLEEAAEHLGRRVFLTTGRRSLPIFTTERVGRTERTERAGQVELPGRVERVELPGQVGRVERERWFLARSVDPPEAPVPPNVHVVLARGPYTVDGELALMREHGIDTLVTKDSGGELTMAKLVAARELGVRVVMVNRPPLPDGLRQVDNAAEAASWAARA